MDYNDLLADNNRKTQIIKNLQDYIEILRADTLKLFADTLTELGPNSEDPAVIKQYQTVLGALNASVEILKEKGNTKQVKS